MREGIKIVVEDRLPDDVQRQSREKVLHFHDTP